MTERINPPARLTVPAPAPARRVGRPNHPHASGLRARAWWLIRQLRRFTLDDLLFTLDEGLESMGVRDVPGNLQKYITQLERAGVLVRLERRAKGLVRGSNGHVIWRLAHDLGRIAPVWRGFNQALWDPNACRLLVQPLPPAAGVTAAGTAPETPPETAADTTPEAPL